MSHSVNQKAPVVITCNLRNDTKQNETVKPRQSERNLFNSIKSGRNVNILDKETQESEARNDRINGFDLRAG
jgi:hypothetical protein